MTSGKVDLQFQSTRGLAQWETLSGDSPEYQGLVDDRLVAMDARFSLVDGLS